jgi:hypothetical protein
MNCILMYYLAFLFLFRIEGIGYSILICIADRACNEALSPVVVFLYTTISTLLKHYTNHYSIMPCNYWPGVHANPEFWRCRLLVPSIRLRFSWVSWGNFPSDFLPQDETRHHVTKFASRPACLSPLTHIRMRICEVFSQPVFAKNGAIMS